MKPILRPRSGVVGCDAFRGNVVVHVCARCSAQQATYEGAMPRDWKTVAGREFCRKCLRATR